MAPGELCHPNRLGDVFELAFAAVDEPDVEAATDLIGDRPCHQHAARVGCRLHTTGDNDAVSQHVVVLQIDVA